MFRLSLLKGINNFSLQIKKMSGTTFGVLTTELILNFENHFSLKPVLVGVCGPAN